MKVRGIALLETAIFLSILLGVILTGFGLWGYIERTTATRRATERGLIESKFRPFSVRLSPDGNVQLELHRSAINSFVEETADRAALEIRNDGSGLPDEGSYFVEARWALYSVDPSTGVCNPTPTEVSNPIVRGSYGASTELLSKTDLTARFQQIGGTTTTNSSGTAICLLAVPTGQAGAITDKYVEMAVVVGVRVLAKLDDSLSRLSAETLLSADGTGSIKTMILRGDMR